MVTKNTLIISALLAFGASTSFCYAEPTTWEFETDSTSYDVDNSGNAFGNFLSVDNDNDGTPELTIQAWADTGCGWNCGSDSDVEQGFASTNAWGLLNYNLDSSSGSLTGENHVIDNINDVDMMLFSFSQSTALTGIDLGWFDNDSDVSIAAFSSLPTLSGNTWSEIVTQSIFTASFSNLGNAPYTLANEVAGAVVDAQYWLIGAYNSSFGLSGADDNTSDAFKLSSITTEIKEPNPPTEVSEPSSIALFASFGLFLMWRRRKSI